MPRLLRPAITALLAVVLVASACGDGTEAGEGAGPTTLDAEGTEAPDGAWPHDFVAPLVAGGTIDAGDYEGQDLVLWFWAPW